MKAITVEPKKPATARFEDFPEPEEREGSVLVEGELPRDREILVICRSGQRAYYTTRILLQDGFKARNISGGMLSRSHLAGD